MNEEDSVADDEILYRGIQMARGYYKEDANKRIYISESAFGDKRGETSFDRAKLCDNDPAYTQVEGTDGVILLTAAEIRGLAPVILEDEKKRPIASFWIIVKPDPIPADNPEGYPENPAHSVAHCDPQHKGAFRKLKAKLAFYINARSSALWQIPPGDLRDEERPGIPPAIHS